MRINSIPPKELLTQYVHVRERFAVQSSSSGVDKTELTDDARTFSVALKTVRESLESRTPEETAHLNQIAAQVKNGTYTVPGFKVAEKIMCMQS
ncbi:MAG: flagellar biosynthesis anti-sigma factor FlgM [Bacillota bacterium]